MNAISFNNSPHPSQEKTGHQPNFFLAPFKRILACIFITWIIVLPRGPYRDWSPITVGTYNAWCKGQSQPWRVCALDRQDKGWEANRYRHERTCQRSHGNASNRIVGSQVPSQYLFHWTMLPFNISILIIPGCRHNKRNLQSWNHVVKSSHPGTGVQLKAFPSATLDFQQCNAAGIQHCSGFTLVWGRADMGPVPTNRIDV